MDKIRTRCPTERGTRARGCRGTSHSGCSRRCSFR